MGSLTAMRLTQLGDLLKISENPLIQSSTTAVKVLWQQRSFLSFPMISRAILSDSNKAFEKDTIVLSRDLDKVASLPERPLS